MPCSSKGANLAKPTTTQRALDRVHWEIRWMDLMGSDLDQGGPANPLWPDSLPVALGYTPDQPPSLVWASADQGGGPGSR